MAIEGDDDIVLITDVNQRLCVCCESVASEVYHLVQKFFIVFRYSEDALVCVVALNFS